MRLKCQYETFDHSVIRYWVLRMNEVLAMTEIHLCFFADILFPHMKNKKCHSSAFRQHYIYVQYAYSGASL